MTQRFWQHVVVPPAEEACWKWKGSTRSNYASIDIPEYRGFSVYAHVFSWFIHNGRWPEEGKMICHTRNCTSKECCNPEHLYEGTAKENTADYMAQKYGEAA